MNEALAAYIQDARDGNLDAPPTTNTEALEEIAHEVAKLSANIVEDAWRIGEALNRASVLIGSSVQFGVWRREHIEPLGISKRTAQRMQNINEAFSYDRLPKLNLSVLYAVSSDGVAPNTQQALLCLADARAKAGEPLTARETNERVSRVAAGRATYLDIQEEAREVNRANGVQVDEEAPAPAPAPQRRRPVVVDNGADESLDWAQAVVRTLKSKSVTTRHAMLDALVAELTEKDLLAASLRAVVEPKSEDDTKQVARIKPLKEAS